VETTDRDDRENFLGRRAFKASVSNAYRDDEAPLRERIDMLQGEQEQLRARANELRDVEAREAELDRELEAMRRRLDDLRGPAMDLERLRIASPCKADWEQMKGDDRVRFCGSCNKNVYNLSGMRRDEATALVQGRRGEVCVRMYRRADGTVLTADCPVGSRKKNVRRLVVLAAGGGAVALAGASLASWTTGAGERHTVGQLEAAPRHAEPVREPSSVMGKVVQPATMGSAGPVDHPARGPMMGAPTRREAPVERAQPAGDRRR